MIRIGISGAPMQVQVPLGVKQGQTFQFQVPMASSGSTPPVVMGAPVYG